MVLTQIVLVLQNYVHHFKFSSYRIVPNQPTGIEADNVPLIQANFNEIHIISLKVPQLLTLKVS